MMKSTDPDGVVTLMAYNTEGEQILNAVDLNRDGNIDYGSDTVQFSDTVPASGTIKDASGNDVTGPVWKTTSSIWQPGDNEFGDATVVSTSLSSPNGLLSSSQSIGVDFPSRSETELLGNGSWTTTTIAPDGTKSLSTYTDGKMASMARLASNNSVIESQTQAYDTLNRPITSTHSRTGASTTNYLSDTADIVASVSDPGNRTTAFTYDVRGRQISVDAPNTVDADNNTLTNITTTTYNPDDTVAETNGDQTYRVSHTYDYADRQISMTTYGTTTATTTWQYSPTRGFLLAKRDAANKGADYTYTNAGRLASRIWARGISTTYTYDNGGRMVLTNYSDTTPDVTMAYDALGRQTSQSNGIATSTFAYNSSNLQLDTETIAYNLDGQPGADFTRVIDRSQDNLGRDTGWTLGEPMSTSAFDNEVAYNYSTTDGRLASVNRGSDSFSYLYAPGSSLVATVTSPVHTVSNVYETTRNVLASKVNKKLDTTTVSSYFYTVNNYGQRTGVTTGGTAFSGTPSWAWGYNSKGEVVKADSSEAGLDRAYAYDGIGNRLSGGGLNPPSQTSYTANALNQYTAIGSTNPSYDDDGNATAYPLPANLAANSALIWDGENRLIEVQAAGTSVPLVRYVYDSQSRRIAETVGSATTVYIYDGWNPIAEYNTSYTLTKIYTWGIDLSGSMQGAGGVGGLLMVTVGSTGSVDRYFPTYDGNGNVSEYLDSTGTSVAHYEYDPFGKATVATGSKAADFSHRFSTKPLDVTTGLYYYGYRYYDPETGRWPSRDPIQERGGINLYSYVGNDGLNSLDLLGLQIIDGKIVEVDAWNVQEAHALEALDYWIKFLGLREGSDNDKPLSEECKSRLLAMIRAMSWAESRHGASPARPEQYPAIDPLQAGDPRNSFWKTMTDGIPKNAGRIVSQNNGNRNAIWIDDLPGVIDSKTLTLPDGSVLIIQKPTGVLPSELDNPANGHRDPKFTPKMSYFWGVFYYLKRTGGTKPYDCGDCTWKTLIDGAVKYNSAQHKGVNHRKKIEDFLKDSGLKKEGEK